MSKYFSTNDPYGVKSNVSKNFECHKAKNSYDWGCNKHVEKLFPRGKVYWKLLDKQQEQF